MQPPSTPGKWQKNEFARVAHPTNTLANGEKLSLPGSCSPPNTPGKWQKTEFARVARPQTTLANGEKENLPGSVTPQIPLANGKKANLPGSHDFRPPWQTAKKRNCQGHASYITSSYATSTPIEIQNPHFPGSLILHDKNKHPVPHKNPIY